MNNGWVDNSCVISVDCGEYGQMDICFRAMQVYLNKGDLLCQLRRESILSGVSPWFKFTNPWSGEKFQLCLESEPFAPVPYTDYRIVQEGWSAGVTRFTGRGITSAKQRLDNDLMRQSRRSRCAD